MNKALTQPPVLISPIPLTEDDIREVQEMYFKEYGEKINSDRARQEAIRILMAIKTAFKPIPKPEINGSIDNSPQIG